MNKQEIFQLISGDAAEIANNDSRIPELPWFGTIFANSHLSDRFAIDYNQKDIMYAWLSAKGKAVRQHKTRPYGPNRDVRSVEALFETLDKIAYDAITKAIENNMRNQHAEGQLLSYVLEQARQGKSL